MFLPLVFVLSAQPGPIRVVVNGEEVRFRGTKAMMIGSSVVVPLRGVFEKLQARVRWNAGERKINIWSDEKSITLTLGSAKAVVDGEDKAMDREAILVDGRTMVPLRFVSEALGAGVTWRPNQRTVTITSHKKS